MSLIAQLQARRADPIASGIIEASRALGGAFGDRMAASREEKIRKANAATAAETNRNNIIAELAGKGDIVPAPEPGAVPLSDLLPNAGFTPGLSFRRAGKANTVPVTPDLLANYKKIRDMGYQVGDEIPASVFNANTGGAGKSEKSAVSEADLKLWAKKLKMKPEELAGVSMDTIKAMATGEGKDKEDLPKQNEFVARNFADMATQADRNLSKIMGGGYDPAALDTSQGTPLPNAMKSGKTQQYEQVVRQFVQAVLRRESGASISPAEMAENRKKYFPERGDDPDVIKQKAEARRLAIAGLEAEGARVPSKLKPEGGNGDALDSLIDKHLGGS